MAEGVSYWDLFQDFFSKGVDRSPTELLPSIKVNLNNITDDNPVVVWFGHSSYFIKINDKNILVDPVFSRRASPFQFIGIKSYEVTHPYRTEDLPEIDILILTHDHYDHLDYPTIQAIGSKVKSIYTTLGVGAHLNAWGFESSKIHEMDWWQTEALFGAVSLTCTPARHFSGRGLVRNRSLWGSFVLNTGSQTLFLGGDSGYDKNQFNDIGRRYGPFDLAILECGQYNKQWPNIHMMPEETVQAAMDLGARALLPVHWGKFTLALHPWYEPVTRAVAAARTLGMPIVTPKIGQPVVVGKIHPQTTWWLEKQGQKKAGR